MLKSEILAALEKIHGDPEIEVRASNTGVQMICCSCHEYAEVVHPNLTIDRINEYPRPEIVVIEK